MNRERQDDFGEGRAVLQDSLMRGRSPGDTEPSRSKETKWEENVEREKRGQRGA